MKLALAHSQPTHCIAAQQKEQPRLLAWDLWSVHAQTAGSSAALSGAPAAKS